ncbi:MAG: type II secretion system protein [Thermotogaceae bacterium]|nr:type II secretion system protein [Thermotogaceae bacterium]
MKRGFRKGFTLIELLIVLAVIAALLAVVTPIALNAVKRANLTKIASNLRNIKSAAETYVTMNYEDLNGNIDNLLNTLKNGYLTTDPNEDPDNPDYSAKLEYSTDVSTVTIEYTGGDASVEDLQKIYSEVDDSDDDNNPDVQFTVGNW